MLQQDAKRTAADFKEDWAIAGFLPVSASQIEVVTDSATCAAVLAAFNAAAAQDVPPTPQAESIYVIRVGSRFAAFDVPARTVDLFLYRTFDENLALLNTYLR